MLYPDTNLLQGVATELTERTRLVPSFSVQAISDNVLAHRVLELHQTLEDPRTPAIERESQLLWVLAQLIAQYANGRWTINRVGAERPYVKEARDYLNVRYADDITLRQLAAAVNISPFHLLRIFKAEVGVPPHTYLTQLRVKHAKRLLLRGLPTADVAAETGFCDQSQLTKRFKQFVGVTPGQYRRSQQ
jgi:AraC-like DNA-binding protein